MAYSLATSYSGQALLSGFDFVSIPDPSDGFVSYQNLQSALAYGYATVDPTTNAVKLSVDSTNSYDSDGSMGGRPSVRIESKQPVNQGLVIGDFAHMPGSICGTWPAFWLYGPNWPDNGEIDIIEGANMAYNNLISAHTGEVCTLPSSGLYTGTQQYTNCTTDEDIGLTEGCNYAPPSSDTSTYGDDFNAVGGGVYAMDWTSESISIWHFPRNKIPANIVSKQPDPSTWGAPQALFGSSSDPNSCDIGASFSNMSIVLDIDFCGDYAGGAQWGSSSCYSYASSCEIWVGNSPSQFVNSYWEVNYIDVYSRAQVSPSSSSSSLPSSETTPASTDIASPSSTTEVTVGPGGTSPGSSGTPTPDSSVPTPIATTPGSPSSADSSASGSVGTPASPPSESATSAGASTPASNNSPMPMSSEPASSAGPSGPASGNPSGPTSGNPSGPTSGSPPIPSSPSVPASSSGSPGGVSTTSPVSSSPSPVDSLVPSRDPATIGTFALLGCFASTTNFRTFSLSGDNGQMTPEVCVGLCPGRAYAGVHESMCYCADALDAGTSAIPDRSRCNLPCPGNPTQFCGGNNLLAKRDAPNSFLLTTYVNLVGSPGNPGSPSGPVPGANPPPAPGLGGPGPGGVTQTIVSTITYTTVCSTNPALLVTQEYCTTLKVPSCARCAAGKITKPTVPMTAITQTCNKCGANGESTVTLTVPCEVASGSASASNLYQQPGPKLPAPGGTYSQQPAAKQPPAPAAPLAAPLAAPPAAPLAAPPAALPAAPPGVPAGGPVPGAPGAPGPNGNGNPAAQPAAKVGNATVPAPTQQTGSTATVGLKPVQAGAARNSGMSAGVFFAVVLGSLLF